MTILIYYICELEEHNYAEYELHKPVPNINASPSQIQEESQSKKIKVKSIMKLKFIVEISSKCQLSKVKVTKKNKKVEGFFVVFQYRSTVMTLQCLTSWPL